MTEDGELKAYVAALFAPEDEMLRRVHEAAAAAELPAISIGPEEGRFLQLAAAAVGARRALEIGTLAGYSGLWIARALPPSGRLITVEIEPATAEVARRNFALAGVADRVEIRVGPALAVLPELAGEPPFDLVFLDADKEAYPEYLDWALRLTRPGAAILAHNVHLQGEVVRSDGGPRVQAMRAFNQRLATDPRLVSTLVPLRDGMSFSIVRAAPA
jgi:predicted O-methyltransferase YrrM